MQIRVRPATAEDAAALAPLWAALGLAAPDGGTSLVAAGAPLSGALVLERGGRVAGLCAWAPLPERWSGRVLGLVLQPEARGQGLDGSLARALVEALPADGYRRVLASGLPDPWPTALRAAGFREQGGSLELATAPLPFAAAFARALDADDFALARRFLDPDCAYEIEGRSWTGPDAILDSYRVAAETARARLDELVNESRVEAIGGDRYRVRYTDRIRAAGHAHTYTVDQVLTVPPGAGIVRIQHRERPGERERLLAFYRRAGL